LDADVCLEVLNICKSVLPVDASLVTNLAMDLSPVHLELLSGMNRIAISLDGLEEGHNAQRLPFVGGGNMWRATLENLRVLVKAGLKDRISVKGCVRDKLGVEEEREFVRLLLRYGISGRSIGLGTMAPTEGVPLPSEIFLEGLGNPKLGNAACCRYRSQVVLVDSTNGVFSDFYEHSRLGSIYDSVDFLREQHDKLVLDSFPALNDPKCMKCSVVGYCWGGCSILGKVRKYSSYCNQAALVERVRDRAKAGSLIGR
jgi:radical SAM protein with 4Fe4S-binding SPASM domain